MNHASRLHCIVLVLLMCATAITPAAAIAQSGPPAGEPAATPAAALTPMIHLQAGAFDPAAGGLRDLPDPLRIEGYDAGQRGYYIVQFIGPVQEEWKAKVAAVGGVVLDYLPDFAFVVFMDETTRNRVAELEAVRAIEVYQPAYRLSPDLLGAAGVRELIVQTFPTEPLDGVRGQALALGAQVREASASEAGGLLRLNLDAAGLARLLRIPAVRWIEPFYERVLHNDVARSNTIMAAETAWANPGLYGAGQIVAVADTGLDTGATSTLAQDFLGSPTGCTGTGRIIATYALGRTGNWSDSCRTGGVNEGGHGTHVSGSVLGNGCRSGSTGNPNYAGSYAGLAPQAGLVMQSVMDSACGLGGLPTNLNTLFNQARDAGARIHTNSWGEPIAGAYTTDSYNSDLFLWNNKNQTVLYSAGNAGSDGNSDGYINQDSLGAPATAKNVITVGASENLRSTGGYNPGGACSTWGGCWPSDYPANPISGDPLSNNVSGMVAFSSRGPTDDGRIKPDVVAPGSNILSTKSQGQYVGTGWGAGPNTYYQYMGGTSMSTPLTAGAMALIREFYTRIKSITPSGALLKATVINSAVNMHPGQYTSPLEQQPPLPNNAQGWGRVNVANATDDSHLWQDIADANGLATGNAHTYSYAYCGASPLKITLVWTDYPGSTSASVQLVNDLDLTLTAPDGTTTYRGNVFSNGWATTGGSADRRNPVESIYVQSPPAGQWTVTVTGYNVPNGSSGRQGYALVVDGASTSCNDFTVDVTPASQATCSTNPAGFAVAVGKLGAFSGAVTLSAAVTPSGPATSFSANPVTPPASSALTVSGAGAGTYDVTVTGTSGALTHQDSATLTVSTPLASAPALTAPADGSTGVVTTTSLSWGAVAGATSYTLQVAADPGFGTLVIDQPGLTGTSFTPGSALAGDTVYYWRVTGTNGCGSAASASRAFRTAAIGCTTYTSTDVPKTIPESTNYVESTLSVPDTFSLTDVNVTIGQISHATDDQLDIYIQHPDTTQVELSTDNGGSGDNYVNTVFDDEAATAITSGTAPFTGSYQPEGQLSNLDGKTSNGTWRLRARDDSLLGSLGTLQSWSLTLCGSAAATSADYTDLAASYGVAWHTGGGTLRLGDAWTADTSFAADQDNASDDGITLTTDTNWGDGSAEVDVAVTGGNGCLSAWMDKGKDGAFGAGAAGAGDLIIDKALVVEGPNAVAANLGSFTFPSASSAYNFRFRLTPRDGDGGCDGDAYPSAAAVAGMTPDAILAPLAAPRESGPAAGGEVEDREIAFGPLSVTLEEFNAEQIAGDAILVTWQTVSELRNRGFNLWRGTSPDRPEVRLNEALIPSQSAGSPNGFHYSYLDNGWLATNRTYYYWLEDVSFGGRVARSGPVSVVYTGGPTAVALTAFGAARSAPTAAAPAALAGVAAIAALALAGMGLRRRR